MRKTFVILVALFIAGVGLTASTSNTLTADEARNHIGETATVCGVVASTHFAVRSKGSPAFVNLDKPYPNQVFTILIWFEDLRKFSLKPSTWASKRVCATGVISSYRGSAEIVAKSPGQIKVEELKPKAKIRRAKSFRLA